MSKSIQDLRERRNAKAKEARDLLEANPGAKWTPAISGQFDALEGEITSIDSNISAFQRAAEMAADDDTSGEGAQRVKDVFDPKDPKNRDRVLFNKWMRGGDDALSNDDWKHIRATMSTTTGSEGGYTVPSLISSQLYDAMKAFGAMRAVADIIPTADGKPLSFPTSDGTSETGEWIAQNTTATAADPTFGTVSLNVFKASSKIVAVPYELLQDAVIDIEGFVRARLAQRLGRLGNTAFTVGTGTTQPDGVVPKATSGKVGTAGQTVLIIYDDIIDLIHSVDPAYRQPGAAFMAGDTLLKTLRKVKDTAGRPIWTPSYDAGINFRNNSNTTGSVGTEPGQLAGGYRDQTTPVVFDYLMGYPVWVNNDMAVPAANAKSLIFGQFGYYKIRDAMDLQMFRFTDSAYTKLGQVAFLAWLRMGGNLVDTAAVKYYAHSAT